MGEIDINEIKIVSGHGTKPETGGCIWDLTIYKATNGQVWKDNLPCFNQLLVTIGQIINDYIDDTARERLRTFEPRLARCKRANDSSKELRINLRLALWAARSVEYLFPAAKITNDVVERYLDGRATEEELGAAARAAEAAAWAAWAAWAAEAARAAARAAEAAARAAWAAAEPAWAAAEPAWAAEAARAAEVAAEVAAEAAWAAARAAEAATEPAWADAEAAWAAEVAAGAMLSFLDDLITQWEKIAADEGILTDLDSIENYL